MERKKTKVYTLKGVRITILTRIRRKLNTLVSPLYSSTFNRLVDRSYVSLIYLSEFLNFRNDLNKVFLQFR